MNSPVPSITDDQLSEAQRLHEQVTVMLRRRDRRTIEHLGSLISHLVAVIDHSAEPSDWLMAEARRIAGASHAAPHLP